MRTSVDRAGRLVIPRRLREQVGLAGGGEVEIELDGLGLRIEPIAGEEVREEAGFLVVPARGRPIGVEAVRALVDADRTRH
jgi:AbrB family looped-hinge helix DNA binding protein